MANSSNLPLHESSLCKSNLLRITELAIFFLLLSLLIFRLLFLQDHGLVWLLAFFCESWFTFNWLLIINAKWNPVEFKTYPKHLLQSVHELPAVDLFVTTADPILEPPIITVNTVLSLLALDYPAHKLACYVSDDGASPVTYHALVEAIKFAKKWIPFCKKYDIQIRAPFKYFSSNVNETSSHRSSRFLQESRQIKEEYVELCRKIEAAEQNSVEFDSMEEFSPFSKVEQGNHDSIVKVIWENKDDDVAVAIPHLVYVSREKRQNYPHNFKAGAMNVLARVSGVMTNSPFTLNVDCDMYANNPQVVLHAMCLLLDSESEQKIAFVQCPQLFYDGLKDDPFGNSLIVIQQYMCRGLNGIQGPLYGGTGCFHRRKVIYGSSPPPDETNIQAQEALRTTFGDSSELVRSASHVLLRDLYHPAGLPGSVKLATHVADCSYESNTLWGTKIGWVYGSATEDVLTGLGIHARGWHSIQCALDPPAFLGCAPSGGPAVMTQQKRWAAGLFEIVISKKGPIFATITTKLCLRQCLAYIYFNMWPLRSIPELCYAILPAYCLLTNTSLMPKVSECGILIPTTLFFVYNVYALSEYLRSGLSVKSWWNNQRMMRINTSTAFLFGFLSVLHKLLGLSKSVFEITRKDNADNDGTEDTDPGRFTFDKSPVFVPGTALVLLHIAAVSIWLLKIQSEQVDINESGCGIGELICSLLVLLHFLPFLKGLFRKGKYGIPSSIICISMALVGLFLSFTLARSFSRVTSI